MSDSLLNAHESLRNYQIKLRKNRKDYAIKHLVLTCFLPFFFSGKISKPHDIVKKNSGKSTFVCCNLTSFLVKSWSVEVAQQQEIANKQNFRPVWAEIQQQVEVSLKFLQIHHCYKELEAIPGLWALKENLHIITGKPWFKESIGNSLEKKFWILCTLLRTPRKSKGLPGVESCNFCLC